MAATVSRDKSGRTLWLTALAAVAAFFVANFAVLRSSASIGTLSESIAANAALSIEYLAGVRKAALEAEVELSQFIYQPAGRRVTGPALDERLSRVREKTRQYLALDPYPGEQPLLLDVEESWLRFDAAVADARRLAPSSSQAAGDAFTRSVEPARQRFLEAVTQAIEHNAAEGRRLASTIRAVRKRSAALTYVLTASCGVLAFALAALLHRQLRSRRLLVESNTRLLEARAAELEQFAGRVAHDIRNPLSSARLAADLAARKVTSEDGRAAIERIVRSLSRADAITTALLDFARSGARPDPGARTDVATAVADVLAGFEAEAAQLRIELREEPVPPVLVACGPGVYASVLGNLVRNAMKYMGDARDRRITVRVNTADTMVRTEVSDTGPGIAAASLPSLFEPYFRGTIRNVEGLGLGLATVKKLAEGHGGRTGVSSALGQGSSFWFELPVAGGAEAAAPGSAMRPSSSLG